MRKFFIMIMAAAAVCLTCSQVFALDGAHHSLGTTYGQCAYCHIPHSAGGDRLWVETPTGPTTAWGANKIGQLCFSCHDGQANNGSDMTSYIYSPTTGRTPHGNDYTALPYEPDQIQGARTSGTTRMAASGFPYTTSSNPLTQGGNQRIQCTSCHTVHTETVTANAEARPYLRNASGNRGNNCERCHGRGIASGNGSKGSANSFTDTYCTTARSYHPVDISATAQSHGASLNATPTATLIRALTGDTTNGDWYLGGHLNAGASGNMECTTCHAVHGDEITQSAPTGNFVLAIDNYPTSYVTSPLCYGCHDLPVVVGGYDHPIDTNRARYAVTYPSNGGDGPGNATSPWPAGASTAAEVVCSSCHDMHGGLAANASDTTQGNVLVGRLRRMGGNTTDWCYSCHVNASPNNHHSHTGNLNTNQADPMTSILTCGSCHGTTDGALAHNNTGGSFFATRAFDGTNRHSNNDYWCQYCHGINPTDINQPTNIAAATTVTGNGFRQVHSAGAVAVTPAGSGVDRGEGTHILGTDGSIQSVNTQVWTTAWPNASNPFAGSIDGRADNYSRYPAGNTIVCESCHNIIGNIGYTGGTTEAAGDAGWTVNLLLADYADDGSSVNAAGNGLILSGLCISCHRAGTIPTGTHQTTGATITAAVDNALSPTTLITVNGTRNTYANATGPIAPRNCSYPRENQMDCDSCHRAHDADNDSTETAAAGGYPGGITTSGNDYVLEVCGAGFVYSNTLCVECHTY